jgi:hypothetical protein
VIVTSGESVISAAAVSPAAAQQLSSTAFTSNDVGQSASSTQLRESAHGKAELPASNRRVLHQYGHIRINLPLHLKPKHTKKPTHYRKDRSVSRRGM